MQENEVIQWCRCHNLPSIPYKRKNNYTRSKKYQKKDKI